MTGENGEGEVERDAAKNLQADRALRESEEKYRILFEFVPVGIGISDLEGRVIDCNLAMLEMTGYTLEEMRAIKLKDTYVNPDEREKLLVALEEHGRVRNWEVRLKRKDGTAYHALLDIDLTEIGGKRVVLTSQRDITERERAGEELEKHRKHLEELVEKRTAELKESERLYRKLIETSQDAVIVIDLEGKISEISQRALEIYGARNVGELLGKNAFELFAAPENLEEAMADFQKIVKEGFVRNVERTAIRKDGARLITRVNAALIKDAHGEPRGVIAAASDITERRRAEEALKESEEKYRSLFEEALDAILVADAETGIILDCNRAASELVGREKSELIGKHQRIIHPPEETTGEFSRTFERHIKEKEGQVLEGQVITKSGEIKEVEIKANLLGLRDKKILHGIFRDITERKRAEDEMKKRLMKFKLEGGKLYLVKEPVSSLSLDAFKDLLGIGYRGLVISRSPELEKVAGENCDFLWVSEKGGKKSLSPKIEEIERRIGDLQRRNAVLLDRLDYLIFKNGFKKTLSFVQRLRESAHLAGFTAILSVDPSTLSMRELNMLEKEALEVEPLHKVKMPEHLLEVLRFVYRQNYVGVKPSYTDIGTELEISKPTVRKRVRLLVSAGYVMETKKGRDKIVELTEGGRRFFLK